MVCIGMLLSIVIPCLNEANTIKVAVRRAYSAAKKAKITSFEVVVADNGSTDGSVEKVRQQKIARLIQVPIRGYGAVLHWGILHARGRYVLYGDADLSYDFAELKRFLPAMVAKQDVVLGSRFRGRILPGAMPALHRYVGTPLLTFLLRSLYRLPTTDCNSGMRLVRKKFYQLLRMRNSGMEWASELLIKTALVGGQYAEVPITLYPDARGRRPHLIPWADGWRHLKAIFLLKPDFLFVPVALFFAAAIFFLLRRSGLAAFFGLLAWGGLLSTLVAKLIMYTLNQKKDFILQVLEKFPVVRVATVFSFLGMIQFFILPGNYVLLKTIFLSAVILYDLWVFFIETIKTHLVSSLPDHIHKRSERKYAA